MSFIAPLEPETSCFRGFDLKAEAMYVKLEMQKAMFFFFIGGLQPRTVTLDDGPQICPSCGERSARIRRIDHYFSLFFIPLFPVKRGRPFLGCDHCGYTQVGAGTGGEEWRRGGWLEEPPYRGKQAECPRCGAEVDPDFSYCPRCGLKL